MTKVIARATNDRGQVVELEATGDPDQPLAMMQVLYDGKASVRWTNEQNAYAQFVNACRVEDPHA